MRSGGPLSRRQLLILLAIATVGFNLVLSFLDRKMTSAGGPSIVGFEFAGSKQRAAEIVAEWGRSGSRYARWSLWVDYGFMLSYGGFFALAALASRDVARASGLRRLASLGVVAAGAAVAAAGFDAIENFFLLLTLGGNGATLAPPLATACAAAKFLLIALAILYCIWGLAARLRQRKRSGGQSPTSAG